MRLGYDRGTILVEGLPGDSALSRLPGLRWDPRVGCPRVPAWRYADLLAALRRRGEVFTDEVLSDRDDPLPAWAPFELRPYQEAALAAWQTGGRTGVVVLPTGSGKTRIACAAMRVTGARTLCLAPTRALVQQWRNELTRRSGLGVGCWGDGQQELRPITVATFESAFRHMALLGRHFELLVVDEVHHFGGGRRDEALELCAAPFRLGLTATGPTGAAAERVEELMGPRVFELRVHDLAGKYLAALDLVVIRLALTPDERTVYEREVSEFRQLFARCPHLPPACDWGAFVETAAESREGRAALAAWRRARRLLGLTAAKRATVGALLERHREQKVLVFTADNDSAYAIAREQLIMPITCEIARRERESALEKFKLGTLRALVSSRVLNEGIDVPDAEVAIVVGGALGQREHVQRVGRLLRPGPGKRALLYELVASATREVRQSAQRRRGLAA